MPFPQHTSRDGDPQLHAHNAVLNRVLRDDPLAARECDRRAWRPLDGAGLFAARPAAGAVAERTLAGQLTARLGVEILPRPDGNGWKWTGRSRRSGCVRRGHVAGHRDHGWQWMSMSGSGTDERQ